MDASLVATATNQAFDVFVGELRNSLKACNMGKNNMGNMGVFIILKSP